MNKVILLGRWTRNVETRYTQDSLCISRGSLAVGRRSREDGADFPSVVAFGKNAEFIEKYLNHKGDAILIEGRLQTGSYTDKDGKKVYTTEVVVEHCEFAGSRKEAAAGEENTEANVGDFTSVPDGVDDEGLPFE